MYMTTDIGLRQRKRDQTKQALKEAAYRLFQDRGYDKASIEDIAREANYAPRTFFLHFAAKEDLLFPDESMMVHSLQTALYERAEGVTALQT
jgi:AcrR family transcriptional regulator